MIEVAKKAVELIVSIRDDKKEEYLRTVRGLGSLVVQNGLLGAILFTKKKGPQEVVDHLEQLIRIKIGSDKFSMNEIINGSITQEKYLQIQIAALDCIKWLKRYSEILLGGD